MSVRVSGIPCPAGMEAVGSLGCLALHKEEYERMEWKDCREFCWETYFAHLGKYNISVRFWFSLSDITSKNVVYRIYLLFQDIYS